MNSSQSDSIVSYQKPPFPLRLWCSLPVLFRAVVAGIVVFQVLQLGQLFLIINFEFAPQIPWVAPLILAFLYFGWRYFAGHGWPRATADSRRHNMRADRRSLRRLIWGYTTGIFVLIHLIGLAIVTSSVIQFPAASFTPPSFVTSVPALSAFIYVIVFALVAGVSEEAGFRGYMQVPLENRYGTIAAVTIVALIFWLAHFEHASFVPRFPILFVSGLFTGFLASYSRSLGPVVLVHFAADTIGFTTVSGLFGLAPLYTAETIWQTGLTTLFLQALVLMIVAGAISVLLLLRMARLKG